MSAPHEVNHSYLSTACYHDRHPKCRLTCKFCGAPCQCRECHGDDALAREVVRLRGLLLARLEGKAP